ncbi:MAG: metal-dependent hydrolase [Planctomycetota bacterium]
MDNLSQALLGAAAARALYSRSLERSATWIGAVSGALADVDVLIVRAVDHPFPEILHRHFTHCLAFIPVGALIAALPFLASPRFRERWRAVLGASLAAYATHGLMDACTSYGTHLLWPFSDARTAWDCLPIIDPIPTLSLLVGVVLSHRRGRRRPAVLALLAFVLYCGLGVIQHERVAGAQAEIAASRGHRIERARSLPMPLSLLLWRSVYVAEGRVWVDHVTAPPAGPMRFRPEGSAEHVTAAGLARGDAELERELDYLELFSDGFMARVPRDPAVIGDERISPTGDLRPLRGVRIEPYRGHRIRYLPSPFESGIDPKRFLRWIRDREGYRPLPKTSD